MNLKNTIFFAVDLQKDFINPNGALYVKDAEYIRDSLEFLTQFADKHNIKVINTADFHTDQSKEISETPDFVNTFPKHCMEGTRGCDFIEETNPKNYHEDSYYILKHTDEDIDIKEFHRMRNIIILKDAFDVFTGNKLTNTVLTLLRNKQPIDNVIVYGVTTNICVKFAVDGLLAHDFKVFLVMDAIKGLPGYPLEHLYTKWLNKGVVFTTTDKIERGD